MWVNIGFLRLNKWDWLHATIMNKVPEFSHDHFMLNRLWYSSFKINSDRDNNLIQFYITSKIYPLL
jgi:hypothetical protein